MWDFAQGAPPPEIEMQASPIAESKLGGELRRHFEVSYTVPSVCADALRAGTADIGIIPAVTYATIPGLVILPDACIAAKDSVRSILLVSRKPIEQVRTIAADTSSRTSVALTEILCRKIWGGARTMCPMPPDVNPMLAACDAALLIGDSALRIDPALYLAYDLAEEWRRLTGKPFVFAVWALRMAALAESDRNLDPAAVLSQSRNHGLAPENIATIARLWSARARISEQAIAGYLTHNIDYTLDAENLSGLELFYRYAAEYGLIPESPALRFYGLAARQFVG